MDAYHATTHPMATIRPLKKSPITEALVDIRTRLSAGFDARRFSDATARLASDYPRASEQRGMTARREPSTCNAPDPSREDLGIVGMTFASADARRILQFRRDGFTLNRLAPYEGWDSMRREAIAQFDVFRAIAPVVSIDRVALRTVNRIVLESPIVDFAAHVTVPIASPPGAPATLVSSFQRTVSRDAEHTARRLE